MPVIAYITPAHLDNWLTGRIGRPPAADATAADLSDYYDRRERACSDAADRAIAQANWLSEQGHHDSARAVHRSAFEYLRDIDHVGHLRAALAAIQHQLA